MKKKYILKIIFVLLIAASLTVTYIYAININNESIDINDFYENINSTEGEGVFSKSELQSLQAPNKNYTIQSPDNFSMQIRSLDNWSTQTSSTDEPIYFVLQKSNYMLRISKYRELAAEKRNFNLPTEAADYMDYVFLEVDGKTLGVRIVSSNHQTSYGPYNVISVKEIVDVQEQDSGETVVTSSDEIISGENVYSISIILPEWYPGILYDKEILTDIYSMIKSINWE